MATRCPAAGCLAFAALLLSATPTVGTGTSKVSLFEEKNVLFIETMGRKGDVLVDGQSLAELFGSVRKVTNLLLCSGEKARCSMISFCAAAGAQGVHGPIKLNGTREVQRAWLTTTLTRQPCARVGLFVVVVVHRSSPRQ